ncbi:S9 family peptidase [Pseudoxanthomonas sp. CAU 1598]|uniref:S9 family peptidase n=2 Tax=Pseudomarimonas arenosa TaxID=2774145 RepID=A0AAW3ZP43_9GAMM|nr:S9 family peptidase [Pseudomarimonas arenosa]MBD8526690.1 S9 family peptidase [Pseudomarimonas arenosa]
MLLGLMSGTAQAGAPDLDLFIRTDVFRSITLSPTGEYLAATVPTGDKTGLVILRRSNNERLAFVGLGANSHVRDFWWVNDERVVYNVEERAGALAEPMPTGELFSVDANGGKSEILVGYRVQQELGTHIRGKKAEAVFATLIDDLPEDDKHVLIAVTPFSADEPYTRAEKLNVYNGRRTVVGRVPVRRASFVSDHQGVIRLGVGAGADNVLKLYYRDGANAEWRLLNDEAESGVRVIPLGFMADGETVLLQSEKLSGPDALVTFDPKTNAYVELLRDEQVDPLSLIYDGHSSQAPVGVFYLDAPPRAVFFDEKSAVARQYRMLEAAFPGHFTRMRSKTKDGKLALVEVSSASNPGDFYMFDLEAKQAEHLLTRRSWFDPAQMHEMKPIKFKARDGLTIHGYLTVPRGSNGKSLPLIVHPHGGPFEIFDVWGFNDEVQLLASAGYAVLQVNFRGSGNYGREFTKIATHQWGGTMQDDLTDATRWAIEQGVADAGRICLYGASYGGYASLMGVAKEPDLYRCAVGHVGVYDLVELSKYENNNSRSKATFVREWIGEGETLERGSVTSVAANIRVPVLLVAGGEDKIAPQKQTELMEKALRGAGVSVETLYVKNEGHGFYLPENRRQFYTQLLQFLAKNLAAPAAETAGSR